MIIINLNKLRNPKVLIPLGVLITNIGNGMNTLAVGKILYDKTGAVSAFAFLLVIQNVLKLLTQAIASSSVDRGRAKQSAFIAEFLRGLVVIICAIIAFKGYVSSIFLATIIISLLGPFYKTASFAIGPMIADGNSLARYNARTSTCLQVGQLLGAGIAGIIISFTSPLFAIVLNGFSYIVSATCIGISIIPNQKIFTRKGKRIKDTVSTIGFKKFFVEWYDLIKNLKENPIVLSLVFLCTFDIIMVSFINIAYVPILTEMKSPMWWLGIWDSAFAIGAIIGANIFGNLKNLQCPLKWTAVSLITQGLFVIGFGLHSVEIVVISTFFIGISNAISVSSFNYSLQKTAAKSFHGRVSGVRQFMTSLMISIFLPVLSLLLSINIILAIGVVSIICVFAALGVILLLKPLVTTLTFNEKG